MLEQIIFVILAAVTLGSGIVVVTNRNLFRAALYLVVSLAGVAGLFVLLEAGFLAVVQIFIYAGAISILIIIAVMLTRRLMNPDTPQSNTQWQASVVLVGILFLLLLVTLWPNPIRVPDVDLPLAYLLFALGGLVLLLALGMAARQRVDNSELSQEDVWWTAAMALIIIVGGLLMQTLWAEPPRLQIVDLTLGGIGWQESGEAAVTGTEGIALLGRTLVDAEQYVVPFEVASVLLLVAMIGAVYIVFPRRGATPTDAEITSTLPALAGGTKEPGAEE